MSDRQIALVTGGSRGIGAEISRKLSAQGFHVVINYATNEDRAKSVLADIQKAGGSGELAKFDVANPDEVSDALKAISKSGTLKVLVNNAGITIDSLLMRMKPEDLDRTLSVDLKGAIYCTKEAARPLMKAGGGSIINISSVVAEMGSPGQAAYAAAKAGLIGFTKSVARELASRKIRVNSITPGFIETEMTDALTDDQKSQYKQAIPLGEFGSPQDVANLVGYLASEESRYITGQIIGVNGGMYM